MMSPQEEIARKVARAGTSFYAAMKVLSLPRRNAMFAIYAFCREVDDIADDVTDRAEKERGLAHWRSEIDALYRGTPQTEIGQALLQSIQLFSLRKDDFIAIIDGMQMDAVQDIWAPSLGELDLYCDRVASAVGRLSVRVFGAISSDADEVAYHLGRALQLTNILRDVTEDAARNRLYLPRELLEKHHLSLDRGMIPGAGLQEVRQELAKVAEAHFMQAEHYMKLCGKRPMRPAAMMGAVYRVLLRRMQMRGWDDLSPVKIPKWQKLWLAVRHGLL